MLKPTCPECGITLSIDEDDLKYYSQFYCDSCDALLEVVEKDPLQLEVVVEVHSDAGWTADDEDEDDE